MTVAEKSKKSTAIALTGVVMIVLAYKVQENHKENKPAQVQGGAIRKELLSKESLPGILSATFHLDNARANRLNSRRDASLLQAAPNAFGPKNPFRPLIELEAAGPGNVWITGDGPTGKITFPLEKGTQRVEIYPTFDLKKLTEGEPGDTETIKIFFEPTKGPKSLAVKEAIIWSGPTEMFLSSKNLIDLAAITVNNPQNRDKNPEEKTKWLQNLGNQISSQQIIYESEPAATGWQKLRSEKDIANEKTANCLDISLLTAKAAKAAGFEVGILANSGHALCTISDPKDKTEPIFFEGTAFLIEKKKNPKKGGKPGDTEPGDPEDPEVPAPNKAPPRKPEPETAFTVSLKEWEPFFRKALTENQGK